MLALNVSIASRAKKTSTLRRDAVPVPLEHLGNYSWGGGLSASCQPLRTDILQTFFLECGTCQMRPGIHESDKRED